MSHSKRGRKALINSLKWGAGICASLPLALFVILIPTAFIRPIGRTLGILVFHLFPRERKRSIKNITESMPSLQSRTAWQRAGGTPYSIAREAFANLGISCIELVKLYYGMGDRIIDSVAISGVENYQQAQSLGKGVILISGHCGNWELMGITVCRHLATLSVVARRQPNAFFNGVIEKLRNKYGSSVIYNKGAAKKIFFALRKKEIVGIIIDQVVVPSEGEIVEFLGRRAWMTNAPPALAEKTGFDEKQLLCWANVADRMRIKGVRKEYAELLQAAGVDTVKELKYRNPFNLAKAMADANKKRKLVRLLPSEKVVKRWIENARLLPLKISY